MSAWRATGLTYCPTIIYKNKGLAINAIITASTQRFLFTADIFSIWTLICLRGAEELYLVVGRQPTITHGSKIMLILA